jgi:hypothetical protein
VFCNQCGIKIPDGSTFCYKCGSEIIINDGIHNSFEKKYIQLKRVDNFDVKVKGNIVIMRIDKICVYINTLFVICCFLSVLWINSSIGFSIKNVVSGRGISIEGANKSIYYILFGILIICSIVLAIYRTIYIITVISSIILNGFLIVQFLIIKLFEFKDITGVYSRNWNDLGSSYLKWPIAIITIIIVLLINRRNLEKFHIPNNQTIL